MRYSTVGEYSTQITKVSGKGDFTPAVVPYLRRKVRRPSYSVKPSNYCKMRPLYTLGFLILSFFSYAQTPTIIPNHIYVYQRKDLDIIETPDSVPSFGFLAFGNLLANFEK